MDGGDAHFSALGKRSYPGNDDETADHGGRQMKQKDANSNPSAVETEYRILCPADKIGSLIGKGGSIIKSLRQECKAKIRVEDLIPGSDERVIYISSVSKDNRHGDNSHQQSHCPAQEALFRVHARILEIGAADDDEDEPPRPVTVRLLVPNVQIGCILGKGGKIIEQMRREIGAQIRVLPREQIPAWVSNSDEMVQLAGDPALVRKALKAVSSRLYENPPRDRISGSSVEGFNLPSVPTSMVTGASFYPSGGYVQQGGAFLAPAHMGGNLVGLGAFYGGTGYGTGWSASVAPSYGVSGGNASRVEDANEEDLFLRLLCPNDKVGSLIGKGGSVIRKMREDTGAHIKVGDPIPDADERVVEIRSAEFADGLSSAGIEAALQVHGRLVELLSDKESCVARLLVPASQIGCILGKGGSIISEIRKSTRANIRIPSKEELPKCASENDELIQISGDESVVLNALTQVLNRLRSNLLRGGVPARGEASVPAPRFAYVGGPIPVNFGMGYDRSAHGGFYPFGNTRHQGSNFGSGGQDQHRTGARSNKGSRRN